MVSAVMAQPVIDGAIDPGTEGWVLLDEDTYALPFDDGTGQTDTSDFVMGGSTFTYYISPSNTPEIVFTNVAQPSSTDNRADVINVYYSTGSSNFYLAVGGPTVPFNSFFVEEGNADKNDDQGDLYIAIDLDYTPSGSLNATNGHRSFLAGAKAVDFDGWTPDYVVGVEYVDNGGGGGGYGNIETLLGHGFIGGAHGTDYGGFLWSAGLNSSAAYDTFNSNAGEFEFRIPWSFLGLPTGPAPGSKMRLAVYTTQNYGSSDAYDSAPGLGNGKVHETIGDNPGDPDAGGQLGPTDPGSTGSGPGANFIGGSLDLAPSHDDGIDTIEEYLQVQFAPPPDPLFTEAVSLNSNSQIRLTWITTNNAGYQLQRATELITPVWTNQGEEVLATSGTLSRTMTNDSAVMPTAFYRVIAIY